MVAISKVSAAKGFIHADVPQGSQEWIDIRKGRPTASRLKDWLAVGKRDGKPLKARLDYEKELNYELTFGVSFSKFTTSAMQAGTDAEAGIREQYATITNNEVKTCGVFYSGDFAASPDGLIGDDGVLECKYLWDNNFSEVLETGAPLEEHYLQIQGQLYATGRKWADYVAANANTGKMTILRIGRNEEVIAQIDEGMKDRSWVKPINTENVFDYHVDAQLTEVNESW